MSMMEIRIQGERAEASFDGLLVATGDDDTPSPFQLFLASLGCSGYCENHDLPTEGLRLLLDVERDPQTRLATLVKLQFVLPEGFPANRRKALLRAAEACLVKRHFSSPPRFETTLVGE
jgi:uncharacterized OsmC-like protein